jgi:hypothetical protein
VAILSTTSWDHSAFIGGYTDYFTRLSKGMQDEVIRRTEYAGV